MWYAIIGEDVEDSLELRRKHRPEHLRRLEALRDEGRLLLAGPFPAIDNPEPGAAGFSGSLIVAEFDSLRSAEQWSIDDPYARNKVYAHTTIKPFKKVLPNA